MYTFIGGPPTGGKSHLARNFVSNSKFKILHIQTDDIRNSLKENKEMSKWVNYFRNQDEVEYWKQNSPQDHVNNLVRQSKALWPEILKIIEIKIASHEHIIFEGVSILPELARKYLQFDGIYLLPPDTETIFVRLQAHSRWGKTDELKRIEAKAFFEGSTNFFQQSAKEYGYKFFNNIENAENHLARLFYN